MPKRIDLSGKQFERLKVVEYAGNTKHGEAQWVCECKCGTKKIIGGGKLRKGITKSCGCLAAEMSRERKKVHGKKGTRIYRIWAGMIQRTTNPKNNEYHLYGERGIRICEEWRNSFEAFAKWADKNGYANNLTIDRKDNDKGYEPDNCRWITQREQHRNKRSNHCLTYKGVTKTLTEWAEDRKIGKETLRYRIEKMGWTTEKALETPVKSRGSKTE